MAEKLTPEHFIPHVNKIVRVDGWPHNLTLTRIDVRRLEEWEREVVPRQPFLVLFRGPPGVVLPEGLHGVRIEGGPTLKLYVIPIYTPQPDRQNYQAAFN